MSRITRRLFVFAAVLVGFAFIVTAHSVLANEPIAQMSARSDGLATVFTASGKLEAVSPGGDRIGFFSNKPFWGPPRRGWESIVLWPADTFLILFVAGPTPVTIDGKKAKSGDLAAGQEVTVQYQITVGASAPMACTAVRIDAHSAKPVSKPSKGRSPKKH